MLSCDADRAASKPGPNFCKMNRSVLPAPGSGGLRKPPLCTFDRHLLGCRTQGHLPGPGSPCPPPGRSETGLLPCWPVMGAHRGLTQRPLSRDARAPSVSPPMTAGGRGVSPPRLLLPPANRSRGSFLPAPRWTGVGVLAGAGSGQ